MHFAGSSVDKGLLASAAEKQTAQDLLYLQFTSGSMGVPKAAAILKRWSQCLPCGTLWIPTAVEKNCESADRMVDLSAEPPNDR